MFAQMSKKTAEFVSLIVNCTIHSQIAPWGLFEGRGLFLRKQFDDEGLFEGGLNQRRGLN